MPIELANQPPPCHCCGAPMTKDGDGWSCHDPECDAHGYVKHETPRGGFYCVHGFTPAGSWCQRCNPLRR